MSDFSYECEVCKALIPSTFANPALPPWQQVVKDFGKKVEVTFRCYEHAVNPPDSTTDRAVPTL